MEPKIPDECRDIQEIRAGIDALDEQIVVLLGRRLRYIEAAAAFKPDQASVRVPERITSMLKQRRVWAEQAAVSPDAVEKLFHDLIEYSIGEEHRRWLEINRGA